MGKMTVGALLLAGGRSRRMGEDKTLLPYKGGTLLSHAAAVLEGFEEKLLSVGDTGYTVPGWRTVPDIIPDRGPLGGIYSALRCCHSDALLVLPCDLPCFPRRLAEYLASFAGEGWNAWAMRSRDGRLQPLCGVYTVACLPLLEQVLEERDGRISALLERAEAHILPAADTPFPDTVFCNINTPQDYRSLKSAPAGRG